MRKRVTFLYFAFITMMFLSMLVENTLDVQTGLMLWATFVPILLFSDNRKPEF
jgi:hypothetical protein